MVKLLRKATVESLGTFAFAILLVVIGGMVTIKIVEEYRTRSCEAGQVDQINRMMDLANQLSVGQASGEEEYKLKVEWCAQHIYVAKEGITNCNAIIIFREVSGNPSAIIAFFSNPLDFLKNLGVQGISCAACAPILAPLYSLIKDYPCAYYIFTVDNILFKINPCLICIREVLGYDTRIIPIVGKYEFYHFGVDSSNNFYMNAGKTYNIRIVKEEGPVTKRQCFCDCGFPEPAIIESLNLECKDACSQRGMGFIAEATKTLSTESYVRIINTGEVH